jgi:hypothetical protein
MSIFESRFLPSVLGVPLHRPIHPLADANDRLVARIVFGLSPLRMYQLPVNQSVCFELPARELTRCSELEPRCVDPRRNFQSLMSSSRLLITGYGLGLPALPSLPRALALSERACCRVGTCERQRVRSCLRTSVHLVNPSGRLSPTLTTTTADVGGERPEICYGIGTMIPAGLVLSMAIRRVRQFWHFRGF